MSVMRVFWLVMAVASVIYVVLGADNPVLKVDLGCAKIGEFGTDSTVQCTDSIAEVFGVWRLVALGVLVSGPAWVASLSARRTVWWGAVGVLLVVGAAGLVNWTSFWGLLIVALPMAAVAAVAVVLDRAVRPTSRGSASISVSADLRRR